MSNTIRKTANTVLDKLAESAQQTAYDKRAKHQKVNVATVAKAFASSVLLSGLLGGFVSYANDDPENARNREKYVCGFPCIF